jgi:inner membrane protein
MTRTLAIKTAFTAFLAIVLALPLGAIREVVRERMALRDGVVTNIQKSGVTTQKLVGPILVVPYRRKVRETVVNAEGKPTTSVHTEERQVHFLPETLTVTTGATTERRYRGIYAALLYESKNVLKGTFSLPANLSVPEDEDTISLEWGDAYLVLGVSDPRGVKGALAVSWDDRAHEFKGGTEQALIKSGVHAPLGEAGSKAALTSGRHRFSIDLRLQGAETFELVPVGKETAVTIAAAWPHPSFMGQFLPDSRTVGASGFEATWRTTHLASNVEQALRRCAQDGCSELMAKTLGVAFIQPVDIYLQTERSAKYGFLFVLFTFVLFYLFELLKRLAIHPIQYALVGVALAMFFLLLVALSEHMAFSLAYVIATAACVALLGFYVSYVLRSLGRGAGFAALLALLYGALYILLQSEDMALLLGAILLFGILAGIMVVTRRVDWYRIAEREEPAR